MDDGHLNYHIKRVAMTFLRGRRFTIKKHIEIYF